MPGSDRDDGKKKTSRAKKPSKKPVKKATKKKSAKKNSKKSPVKKDLSFLFVKKDMLRFIRHELNAGERVSKQFLDFSNAQLHEWTKYVLGFLAISSHGSKRGNSNCSLPRLSLDALNKALVLATDKKFVDLVSHTFPTVDANKTAIGNMLRELMGEKSSVARDALEQMSIALNLRFATMVKSAIQQMRKKKRVTLKVCPDAMQMVASTEDMRAATDEEEEEEEDEETEFDESDGAEEPLVINKTCFTQIFFLSLKSKRNFNQKKEEKKENTQEMSDSDSDTEVQQEFGQRYDSDDGKKKKPSKKSRAKKPSKKPVKKATKKKSAKKPSKKSHVKKDLSFLFVKKDMLRFIRERLNAGERVSKQFMDFANAQLHEWTKYVLGFLAISSHGSNSEGKRGRSNCNSPRLSLDALNKALLLATDKKFFDRVDHTGLTLDVNKTAIGNMLREIMGEKSSVARDALEQMQVALELRLGDIVKVAIQQMRKKKRVTLKVCPDAMQMVASTEDMRAATDEEEEEEEEDEETEFDESDGGAEEPLVINVSY